MSSKLINQVVELTNAERAKAGLQPLKLNSQLVDAAQDHSYDMAQDDFFSHTGVDGSNVGSRVKATGYQYSTTGENIAAGQTTAAEVVEGWMNSPGHRANILNANFTEIGIGYEYLANDTGSVNYNHYWTQVFGTPLNNNNAGSNSPTPTQETSEPAPVEEVENNEPSSPVEDTNDQGLDIEESNLETVEETSEPAPVEEVENSEPSSPVEDTNDQGLDVEESNLETVEKTSEPAPLEEMENSEPSSPVEDTNSDNLDLTEPGAGASEMNHTGDINGVSHSSALAGGGDAVDFSKYLEKSSYLQDTNHNWSNECQLQIESWLGMVAEANGDYDSMDLVESGLNSHLTECKQEFMQEASDSFL